MAINIENRKKHKIFSKLQLPEKIAAPLYAQSDRFDFRMCKSIFMDRNEFLMEMKNCDAIILSSLVRIDKEALDTIGTNLKVNHKWKTIKFILYKLKYLLIK